MYISSKPCANTALLFHYNVFLHQSELQPPGEKKARIKEPKIQVLSRDQIKKWCHALLLVALFPKEKSGLICSLGKAIQLSKRPNFSRIYFRHPSLSRLELCLVAELSLTYRKQALGSWLGLPVSNGLPSH